MYGTLPSPLVECYQLHVFFHVCYKISVGFFSLFSSLQAIWLRKPRYKETIHSLSSPTVYLAVFIAVTHRKLRPWFSNRVLCSSPLNTALFHEGWRKFGGGGAATREWQCVVCRWCLNAQHSCSTPRFYSLPMVPFLALLSGLHIIEVFVPCGRLSCAASMLSKHSVVARHVGRHEFIGPSTSTPPETWPYPLFELCCHII